MRCGKLFISAGNTIVCTRRPRTAKLLLNDSLSLGMLLNADSTRRCLSNAICMVFMIDVWRINLLPESSVSGRVLGLINVFLLLRSAVIDFSVNWPTRKPEFNTITTLPPPSSLKRQCSSRVYSSGSSFLLGYDRVHHCSLCSKMDMLIHEH